MTPSVPIPGGTREKTLRRPPGTHPRWLPRKPACTVTRAARRRSRSPGPGTAPGRRQQEPEGGGDAGGRRADDALDTEPRGEIPGMDRARPTRCEQHVATGVASTLGDVDPRGARHGLGVYLEDSPGKLDSGESAPPRATKSVKVPPMSTPTRVRPDPASLITAALARCPATRPVRPAALGWPAPPHTRADPTPAPRSRVRPPAR